MCLQDPLHPCGPASEHTSCPHSPTLKVSIVYGYRTRDRTDTLVTAMAMFSPVNKRGDGLHLYRPKHRSLLQTDVHLIEFDVLRRWRATRVGSRGATAGLCVYGPGASRLWRG